jgi:hypothetical protein
MMKKKMLYGLVVIVLLVSLTACNLLGLGGSSGATSAELVSAGIDALSPQSGMPDLDTARLKFAQAVQKDPNNAEAVMWSSMLELASISVDPSLRSILTTYFGISGYPSTMNDLFMGDQGWLSMPVDVGYGDQMMMPFIVIPDGIKQLDGYTSLTMDEWLLGLVYNIITKNPDGFNSLTTAVIDNLLVAKLDSILASINSLPSTAKIALPETLFYVGEGSRVVLGKAELQLEAAALYSLKSSLLMAKTISSALPLEEYWDALNPVDNPGLYEDEDTMAAILAAIVTLPTPFSAGFLMPTATAAANLAAARTATLASLTNIQSATSSIMGRTAPQGFTLGPDSFMFSDEEYGPFWSDALSILGFANTYASKLKTAIEGNSIFYMPVPGGEFSEEAAWSFFGSYDTSTKWPISANLFPDEDQTMVVASKPGAAFQTALFALSSWLDMDTITGEPRFYESQLTDGTITGFAGTAVGSDGVVEGATYAIKIKDLALNGSIVLTEDDFNGIKSRLVESLAGFLPEGTDLDVLMNYSNGVVVLFLPVATSDVVAASLASEGDEGSFWWANLEMILTLLKPPLEEESDPEVL